MHGYDSSKLLKSIDKPKPIITWLPICSPGFNHPKGSRNSIGNLVNSPTRQTLYGGEHRSTEHGRRYSYRGCIEGDDGVVRARLPDSKLRTCAGANDGNACWRTRPRPWPPGSRTAGKKKRRDHGKEVSDVANDRERRKKAHWWIFVPTASTMGLLEVQMKYGPRLSEC